MGLYHRHLEKNGVKEDEEITAPKYFNWPGIGLLGQACICLAWILWATELSTRRHQIWQYITMWSTGRLLRCAQESLITTGVMSLNGELCASR